MHVIGSFNSGDHLWGWPSSSYNILAGFIPAFEFILEALCLVSLLLAMKIILSDPFISFHPRSFFFCFGWLNGRSNPSCHIVTQFLLRFRLVVILSECGPLVWVIDFVWQSHRCFWGKLTWPVCFPSKKSSFQYFRCPASVDQSLVSYDYKFC